MKRLVIACILILALTNQAYAMGWHGGGNGGGGSSQSGSTGSASNSGTSITPPNSPRGGSPGETGGQGSTAGSTITVVAGPPPGNTVSSVPEVTTMFLLCSALFGLWGLRRKIKK
jgi:hypothetical protein